MQIVKFEIEELDNCFSLTVYVISPFTPESSSVARMAATKEPAQHDRTAKSVTRKRQLTGVVRASSSSSSSVE